LSNIIHQGLKLKGISVFWCRMLEGMQLDKTDPVSVGGY
jgi:hypothetical protein